MGIQGPTKSITDIISREKGANTNWEDASDGTLEERVYYCQNWCGDVSVVIEDDAEMVEWVKYSSNGRPFGLPKGDQDSDGDLDQTDVTAIQNWEANPYDVRADLDLDGDVDSTDATLASNASPITLGWGNLSDHGNRKGYGGYELDPVLAYTTWHVRNRVLISDLGRWITRDPMGYVGGMNLYQYVGSNPLRDVDPFGLLPPPGGGGLLPGGGRRPVPDSIYPPGYSNAPELVGLITWFKKRLACWRCIQALSKIVQDSRCNRKGLEEECWAIRPFDPMEINLCLLEVPKKISKCIQRLADALPDCIKCAYIVPKPTG